MVGGGLEARQAALQDFLHDPACRVLLLMKSTSGGAAGGFGRVGEGPLGVGTSVGWGTQWRCVCLHPSRRWA